MMKMNKKSKEGVKKKIALISLATLLFNVAMFNVFVPSASLLQADDGSLCAVDVDVVLVMDRSGSMGEGEAESKCEWEELEWTGFSFQCVAYDEDGLEQLTCEAKPNVIQCDAPVFTPATNSKITDAKAAANTFLGYLGTDDQSALVSFADVATLEKQLSNDHSATQDAVDALVMGGNTNIGDAIMEGTTELGSEERANPQAVKVMILLTDGKANMPNGAGDPDPEFYAKEKAEEAAALGYKVFTIGLGGDVNETMLQYIANSTQADYYPVPTSADLEGIYDSIRLQICEYGSISGCKYSDTDKDGDESDFSGEDTISEWEIILTGGANGPISKLTDEDGCYSFTGLSEGTYIVSEGAKVGVDNFAQTYPAGGSHFDIPLIEGGNLENYDFGNYLPICGNGILDENYSSYNEECDGQEGVGDHQSCSNECTLIDLTYCGDGIKQTPNDEGTGGPQNDGYEQCDGQEGIDSGQVCLADCVIEDSPVCQANEASRVCVSDGFAEVSYEYYPVDCDYNYTEIEADSDCACIETEVAGKCVDETNREFTYIYNYDYCGAREPETREDETCGEEPIYQCSDGVDNDGDGQIDYPNDPGCDSLKDDEEYNIFCGDGSCNGNETCSTCAEDCGSCGGGAVITKPIIIITNEKVKYLGDGNALVTWTTNIETTRQVVYGDNSISSPGKASGYGYDSVSEESTNMTEEHSVVISGLIDGIAYYFRPVADRSGSTGEIVGIEVFYELGEVKGVSDSPEPAPEPVECNYLLEYIKLGAQNNPVEVEKLERFLNEFEGENLVINGIYEQVDFGAVSRFQEKYLKNILSPWSHNKATGYVYITTKKKINELYCEREFPLTFEQEAEIARFSSIFDTPVEGAEMLAEGGNFVPENDSTEDMSEDLGSEKTGEVAGAKDEIETEEESREEQEKQEQQQEEPEKPADEEKSEEPMDSGATMIGEKDELQEDGLITRAFKDYGNWIWLIVAIVIGIIIYSYFSVVKQKIKEQ